MEEPPPMAMMHVGAGSLEGLDAVLDVLDGGVGLDVAVESLVGDAGGVEHGR